MIQLIKRRWTSVFGVIAGAILVFYVGSGLGIGQQVRRCVSSAQSSGQDDPVSALMAVINSPEKTLKEKNSAVWALGQLGDPRALSLLEELQTGQNCDHESRLCQKELGKAVKLCRGEANIGALVWRHGDLALAETNRVK